MEHRIVKEGFMIILHHYAGKFLGFVWHRIAKAFWESPAGQVLALINQSLIFTSQMVQQQVTTWQQLLPRRFYQHI
jgi:hypothetical protein